MKYCTLITILLIFFGCNNQQKDDIDTIGKEIVLRLEPTSDNPRNSEGDFIQLKDGHILFIYTKFTSGSGDHAKAHLASRISADKGKTWSKEDKVVVTNEGLMNVMSVSLLRLDDGRIALFYLRKNSTTECIPFIRISSDEAKTWSKPTACIPSTGYHVMNNDRVIQLKSGRIVLPLALHGSTQKSITANATIYCYYSDDLGETWQKSESIQNKNNTTLQEPGIIELKDGKIMLFCRTESGVQYFSYSNNECESWTPIEPGNIKSPLSPASIKRIPTTGDLLLVWNNNFKEGRDGGKRTPYNMAISKDEGKTWIKTKTIESDPDGWYCYTAINFVDDYVLLGHCAGNRKLFNGLETTQITRLHMDWIYDDAITDPFIKSDNNGKVELACNENNVQIRYTLDGRNPDETSAIYNEPFSVSRTTLLRMQANKPEKPCSIIVSEYVGTDILQEPMEVTKTVLPGLNCKYFEGKIARTSAIEKLKVKRSGVSPTLNIEKSESIENFAFSFTGLIEIPKDGKYTFYLNSNDGSILKLDEYLLIENDGPHGDFEKEAPVALRKGFHSLEIKYFQNGGSKELKLSWEGDDFKKCEIPDSALYHVE
ncbi:MAG: exo-alpha-sialidase [Bacteroidetes bacterium]|nr:exo-alpha-sialidase [Bacteroidota bacterium]